MGSTLVPELIMEQRNISERLGASVRRLRSHLGISQEELAERADLHRTYIAGIEGGARNLTLKSIDRLARALQVSIAALLLDISQYGEILLVEDNQDDVELTLQAFKRAKITNPIFVVGDGAEALDYLFCNGRFAERRVEDRPHLVLLDLDLPKVGGLEVLRRIKADERTKSIPVAVLTGSLDERLPDECQRSGAHACIAKPVDFQGLTQATRRLNLSWALLETGETSARDPSDEPLMGG
jgi:CheY-like chemotaxis protein